MGIFSQPAIFGKFITENNHRIRESQEIPLFFMDGSMEWETVRRPVSLRHDWLRHCVGVTTFVPCMAPTFVLGPSEWLLTGDDGSRNGSPISMLRSSMSWSTAFTSFTPSTECSEFVIWVVQRQVCFGGKLLIVFSMARLKSNKNNFSVHAWSPLVVAMLHQLVQFNNVVLPAPKKVAQHGRLGPIPDEKKCKEYDIRT